MGGRALVTGATGFLGQHLALRLAANGDDVVAMVRSSSSAQLVSRLEDAGVDIIRISDPEDVTRLTREAGADRVFHLATHYLKGHTAADIPGLVDANVTFGARLLDGLSDSGATVVSASSFFQFRHGRVAPASLYAATKQAFSDISEYYRTVVGLPITQVVLYDTFGPGDTRDKLVPHLISSLLAGGPVRLGPAAQQLNLLYVDDVVSGLIAAAVPGSAPLCTVRAESTVTVAQLVDELSAVAGRPIEASFNAEATPNDLVTTSGDWPTPIGWTGARPLRDGLTATWAAAS